MKYAKLLKRPPQSYITTKLIYENIINSLITNYGFLKLIQNSNMYVKNNYAN